MRKHCILFIALIVTHETACVFLILRISICRLFDTNLPIMIVLVSIKGNLS